MPSNPERPATPSPELGLTMTQVLRNPLTALRASMESLSSDFAGDESRALQLRGALEQVLKMSRDVDALVQLTAPRALAPLDCTVEEILRAAQRGLQRDAAARVQLAEGCHGATLSVDGPLLADCLFRLLDNALASCDEPVLLSARVDGEHTLFSIVEGGDDRALRGFRRRDLTVQRAATLELALALARRDIERLGGSLQIAHTLLGNTCVVVRIPNAPAARS